jgi:hypothetical protein
MRFVPTSVHGVADYVVGLLLVAFPIFLRWPETARLCFMAMGLFTIFYSAVTDYEFGVYRYLRIRFHLFLDAIVGILLLLSPVILHIPENHHAPVYALGVLAIVLAATTRVRAEGSHSMNNADA